MTWVRDYLRSPPEPVPCNIARLKRLLGRLALGLVILIP